MEKLTEEQRVAITKMSDVRLKNKLVQAGYREDVVAQLSRAELMTYFAEVVAAESAKATAQLSTGVDEVEDVEEAGNGQTLEERRLLLEERRLVEQRLQREFEQRKMEMEEKKWKAELEFKKLTAQKEQAHNDSMAVKLKTWGDALKNAITKMPNEPIDVISWFVNVERLFEQLKTPVELQAVLIRPYLSERARILLSRCDPTKSKDYASIKKFLLQEFHLSPTVYLEKFHSMQYDKSETYSQFLARLTAVFNYYVESRKIEKDFDKLLELIVYDRIKSVLPPFLSTHVIALESAHKDGWLGKKTLADALDAYMANKSQPDNKPRVPVSGSDDHGGVSQRWKPKFDKVEKPEGLRKPRKCFICNSPSHLASSCPDRVNKTSVKPTPKVTRVSVGDTVVGYGSQEEEICSVMEEAERKDAQDPVLVDGWSELKFVEINVDGLPGVVQGLNDSGAQLCVVRADVIQSLDLPKLGEVKLRGLTNQLIPADLVSLKMKMSQGDAYCNVTCAVCENLNSDLILGSDVIDRLNAALHEQCESISVMSVNEDETCDVDVVAVDADAVCDVNDDDNVAVSVDDANDDSHVSHVNGSNDECDQKNDDEFNSDPNKASVEVLRAEQESDKSLAGCWSLAERDKAGYFVRDCLLYRHERILGQNFEQLCLPYGRRAQAIKLAHETFGGHLGAKKTKARLKLSFTWPTISVDVQKACEVCHVCQKRRRVTVHDRTPISPIPRGEVVFDTWVMDCLGPLNPNVKVEYNYALVLCDSCSRYPVAFALRSLTAKSVCNALLQLFQITGVPSTIRSDCAANFTSQLTTTFLKQLGCSPNFNVPGRPQQTGLCERLIGTLKNMISKVATENPKSWSKYLGYVLWALREVPNETTGVPPWLMVYGRLPRGPLAVLKENWCGQRELPLNLGKTTVEYLEDLRKNLEVAQNYATSHTQRAQQRYVSRYNLRAREKSFTVGEKVLVLIPDSTASKTFSKWQGPGTIKEKRSAHTYMVDINGSLKHLHADKLRKYHIAVDEVICDTAVSGHSQASVNHCAIVYDEDKDFGDLGIEEDRAALVNPDQPELLPSQKIDPSLLSHLTHEQRSKLLAVLDKFPECFADKPGFCNIIQHKINVSKDFKPKRLREYRVPESLKAMVEEQIQELLSLGIIKPSHSEMASPIVCVLKGKDGRNGVRIAVDYRYLNKYCEGDSYPMPDIPDLIQRVGQSDFISLFDIKAAYHNIAVHPDHQWLTAFVWDGGLYEYTRAPFGQKGSGNTFVRAVQQVLYPVRSFTGAFVDDISVHSNTFDNHLIHLEKFLQVIKESGFILNLKKCRFVQSEVKFLGHIVGSGQRRPDPDKVATVHDMKAPETKKQVRRIIGFFSYFRDYLPSFSEIIKPLTDLTGKRIPSKVPWGTAESEAFEQLKEKLCQATMQSMLIADFTKPFTIHVDATNFTVAGALTQQDKDGKERPIAFASLKLNPTQRAWSTIEKEAYAAIWALGKFRCWIFSQPVTLYSDHNPLQYLTEAATKSAKLTRWSMALQQYNVTFRYKAGRENVVADCLSRLESDDEPTSPPQ